MRANALGRICSFFFAAVFLTAAQGQALGLRHCSLHDALPASAHPGSAAHGSSPSSPDAPDRHHAQEGQHSGGPGGCIDDCHVGSTTVAPGQMGQISAAPRVWTPSTLTGSGGLQGPRHLAYELHLPNAPPPSA